MSPHTAAGPTRPARVSVPNRGRYYRDPASGLLYPSVTTVLDTTLNKKALVGWAARTVAEEALANLPMLVRWSRTDRPGAVAWLKGRPYEQRDAAADVGTALHDLAEAHVLGKPVEAPHEDSDVARMLDSFLAFLREEEPAFEATEMTVVNRTLGYAGTLDAIARLPRLGNRLLVLDWKTGKTGPYGEWGVQVAAYARAEAAWLKDGTEVPMPPVDGAAVVRVRPDHYAVHPVEVDLDELLDVFEAMLRVARWSFAAEDTPVFRAELPPAGRAEGVA